MKQKVLKERVRLLEQRVHTLETCSIPARKINVQIPDYANCIVSPGIGIRLPKLINLLLSELNLELVETPKQLKLEKRLGKCTKSNKKL